MLADAESRTTWTVRGALCLLLWIVQPSSGQAPVLNIASFSPSGDASLSRFSIPSNVRFEGYSAVGGEMIFATTVGGNSGPQVGVMRFDSGGMPSYSYLDALSGELFDHAQAPHYSVLSTADGIMFPTVEAGQATVVSYSISGDAFSRLQIGAAAQDNRFATIAAMPGEIAMNTKGFGSEPSLSHRYDTSSDTTTSKASGVQFRSAMQFDRGGTLHMAGVRETGFGREMLYSTWDEHGTFSETVAAFTNASGYVSMALDNDDSPLIAAWSNDDGAATIWSRQGDGWIAHSFDSEFQPGWFFDIEVADDGTIFLGGADDRNRAAGGYLKISSDFTLLESRMLQGLGDNGRFVGFDVESDGSIRVAFTDDGTRDGDGAIVPLPSAAALAALGFLGLSVRCRRGSL